MKLKINKNKPVHTNICSIINWSGNSIYSFSDDMNSFIWNSNAEYISKFNTFDCYITSSDWNPSTKIGNELLAVGTADGQIRLYSKNGKLEKTVSNCHSLSVTSLQWSSDGTTLVSASDDGSIKTWSKNLELRNSLVKDQSAIYSVKWNSDASYICYTNENDICIEPVLKGGLKTIKFKAHDEVVLCLDWSFSNRMIISGGEDKKYKIWDQYGRNLYTSSILNCVVTSLAWNPSGEYFAVGTYETIRLCNKTGWSYSFSKIKSGGILSLSWSNDGNTIAGGCGNGSIITGTIVDRSVNWQNMEIRLDENNKLIIHDYDKQTINEIDFRDSLVNMKAGYNYLIVITQTQCHLYPFHNLNAPFKFDIKEKIRIILTSTQYFCLIDDNNGIFIYTYEGKQVNSPSLQGIRISSISQKHISLSNDLLALVPQSNQKQIRFFDISSGKGINSVIEHTMDILEISLNQSNTPRDRKICFIDNNKDLYLSNAFQVKLYKICSMCDTFSWNESNDMLSAISDEKYYTWIYPNSIYIDKELLDASKYEIDASEIGRNSQITSFQGSMCHILKADGTITYKSITPYASILLGLLNFQDGIERGLKLCRYVKDKVLWAAFSAICINFSDIPIAEVAVAAIDEVDKIQFIEKIVSMKGKVNESVIYSYILLLSNKIEEAEGVLIQSKFIYRAIKININLFRWDRALALSQQYKVFSDLVLGFRNKYLEGAGLEETNSKFLELAKEVTVDWKKIGIDIEKEKENERIK